MSVQGYDSMMAESDGLVAYQGQLRAQPDFGSARVAALRPRLADLLPVTMIVLGLGLTAAWTGLLVSLAWWGIDQLI
jgi:hypothetical protein